MALPGFNFGWFSKRESDGLPPAYIRDQFPQFNDTQWEKYHCFTFADLLATVPPCADYCETYSIGELSPGGFGRDGCHQVSPPCASKSDVLQVWKLQRAPTSCEWVHSVTPITRSLLSMTTLSKEAIH
jgi:hypothetical protein